MNRNKFFINKNYSFCPIRKVKAFKVIKEIDEKHFNCLIVEENSIKIDILHLSDLQKDDKCNFFKEIDKEEFEIIFKDKLSDLWQI